MNRRIIDTTYLRYSDYNQVTQMRWPATLQQMGVDFFYTYQLPFERKFHKVQLE